MLRRMPNDTQFLLQMKLRAPQRSTHCRRRVCKRFRWCVPLPDRDEAGLPRCRFENRENWEARVADLERWIEELVRPYPLIKACMERRRDDPGVDLMTAAREVRAASAADRDSGRGGSRRRKRAACAPPRPNG